MTTEQLINNIAAATGCTPEQIMGNSRIQRVADARAVLQYSLRERNWTLQRIADAFKCDHSSVCCNVRKMVAAMNLIETYKSANNDTEQTVTSQKIEL